MVIQTYVMYRDNIHKKLEFCLDADFTKPFLAFSLCKSRILKICYSCYFCHICYSIFSHSKKNSSYFCAFWDICYFLYTFLIAVFFKSFLLKLRKQFPSKFLLTRSILDISVYLSSVLASFSVSASAPAKANHEHYQNSHHGCEAKEN